MIRRALMFFAVTAATATAALYWLHDGDLAEAVQPVVREWDADRLVQEAGLQSLPGLPPLVEPPSEPTPADAAPASP
jgi:hypothetical protein